MRRVADAVGITPMAIYRHYPNREAMLDAVADAVSGELAEQWGRRDDEPDLERRILGLLNDFLDFALGRPHLYALVMIERRAGTRTFPADYAAGRSPSFAPMLRAVEDGMAKGFLREGDPAELAMTFAATGLGLAQLYLGGRIDLSEKDFRQLCRRSVFTVLDGARAHGPDSTTR
ncbi:TetR family transcriptional regulator [Labedaea rhizosphaerae]|uniref:TetR family transcriptional regulator n=2 Tax=Labedaea rhizosphaerae TaxID=598644 RepID=A0A4V3CYG9_LABRH|nr:TetR family transcriptional regulator [Labedaea rhizosphaerae]